MKKIILNLVLAAASCAILAPAAAQAATATSPVIGISLAVNSPVCTVTNSTNSIVMPPASLGQSTVSYQALNLPLRSTTSTGPQWTSTSLNQTATISCNTANTPISSFVVKPGPSATTSTTTNTAAQWLVDATTPTPVKVGTAAFGNFGIYVEQVSVNNSPAEYLYADPTNANVRAYTTVFQTGALSTGASPVSTATVVWRPTFYVPASNTDTFGNPTGGSYNGSFQIVVNY